MTGTPSRPAWVEVDLKAIAENLAALRQKLGPRKILGTIKANAYGHGMVEVARVLERAGVDMLGVSILDEAMDLRRAQIATPILIMGTILPEEAERAVELKVTVTLCSLEVAQALAQAGKRFGRTIKAHVKIDTGMGRFGALRDDVIGYVTQLKSMEFIELEGIYTHFPVADEQGDEFTLGQIRQFNAIISELEGRGVYIPLQHAANSAAILNYPQSYFNLVRPGITLYGLYPSERVNRNLPLKPALSWKARILTLKQVPRDWSISYGRTYVTPGERTIAIIPVGYADGFNRHLSNRGQVLVRGRRAPAVGAVCMDQFMVDVTDIPGVAIGDEVVLIGKQGDDEITADEVAHRLDTINYEVICSIASRVPRSYKR
ncbi:MAG: alanine racemase [bacterium]